MNAASEPSRSPPRRPEAAKGEPRRADAVRSVAAGASPDPAAYRRALGAFPTGVTVVCTLDAAGAPVGFTANSFTSVSLNPPLVLVCVAHSASSHAAFDAAPRFAISVLSQAQEPVARMFATPGADRFAATRWRAQATGAPVIEGAVAWFDCTVHQRIAAGDHDVLIGKVEDFGRQDAPPLAYAAGRFSRVGPALRLVGLAHCAGRALFCETDAGLRLPDALSFGPADDARSLTGLLAARSRGLGALLPVGAFDAPGGHATVYAAAADALTDGAGWRVAPLAQAAEAMACEAEAAALRALAPALG